MLQSFRSLTSRYTEKFTETTFREKLYDEIGKNFA